MVPSNVVLQTLVGRSKGRIVLKEVCSAVETLYDLITAAVEIVTAEILFVLQVIVIHSYRLVIGKARTQVVEGDFKGIFTVSSGKRDDHHSPTGIESKISSVSELECTAPSKLLKVIPTQASLVDIIAIADD